jgi:ERCC4-type nuclease
VLISPTEPALLKDIGRVSSQPERYGADFLWASRVGLVGVQRKEINDLVSSLRDGRLAKEMGQWSNLDLAILVVEGKMQWSTEGYLLSTRQFTKAQLLGVLFSVQMTGAWSLQTETLSDTALVVKSLETWLSKDRHGTLRTRPKAQGVWGSADNREWGIHLLQSFSGIGSEVAGRIYDHFSGVPMEFTCTEEELMDVQGIGRLRAMKMIEALSGNLTTS